MDPSHFLFGHIGERPEGCASSAAALSASKDANGCSGRGVRKRTIAVKRVGRRLDVGDVGRRGHAGYARTENGRDRRREQEPAVSAKCVAANAKLCPSWRWELPAARSRAQDLEAKIYRPDRVSGRVATSFSPFRVEHSCKRFCSVACRLALRRVLDRERVGRRRRRAPSALRRSDEASVAAGHLLSMSLQIYFLIQRA